RDRAHRLDQRQQPLPGRRGVAPRASIHRQPPPGRHRRQHEHDLCSLAAARLRARAQALPARGRRPVGPARGFPAALQRHVRADAEHDALLCKRVLPHQLPVTAPAGDKKARVSTALAALLVFAACAALAGEKQPREYLDEDTAATVTVVGEPLVFAYADAAPNVYGTDLGTVRFIGEARELTIVVDSDPAPITYELWEDHRVALRNFVHHMSGGR